MPEITRAYIAQKRQAYQQQLDLVNGALLALDEIERELFPPEALSLEDLKQVTGAVEIEAPQPLPA